MRKTLTKKLLKAHAQLEDVVNDLADICANLTRDDELEQVGDMLEAAEAARDKIVEALPEDTFA